jgi:integrase
MAVKSITISKITNAKGEIRYRVDYYDQWGRRCRPSFPTKREAEDHKKLLLQQFATGQREASPDDMSIKDAIEKYGTLRSEGKVSKDQDRIYFHRLYDFLLDECGLYSVQEITPLHMEQFQALRATKVAGSTVNREFNTYRNFFTTLVRWGSIAKSPTDDLENLPVNPHLRKPWTVEQTQAVINVLPRLYGDFIFAMAVGGFRNVELRNMTWRDVDFERRVVIAKSRKNKGGLKARVVPMTQEMAIFFSTKRDQAPMGMAVDSAPVFINSRRTVIDNWRLAEVVNRACEKLGFVGLTAYGLRHSLVTEMQSQNLAEEKIKRIVGHSANSRVTAMYTHLNVQQLRDALESTEQAQKLTRYSH